jgi:gluconolactonase
MIEIPETPANCGWGDADYHGLYITARTSVYRVRLNVKGSVPYVSDTNQ